VSDELLAGDLLHISGRWPCLRRGHPGLSDREFQAELDLDVGSGLIFLRPTFFSCRLVRPADHFPIIISRSRWSLSGRRCAPSPLPSLPGRWRSLQRTPETEPFRFYPGMTSGRLPCHCPIAQVVARLLTAPSTGECRTLIDWGPNSLLLRPDHPMMRDPHRCCGHPTMMRATHDDAGTPR